MYEEIIQQKLICITNRHLVQGDFLDRIRQIAAKKQVDAIILREKDLSEEDYRTLAEAVLEICRRYEKTCILHTFVRTAVTLHHPYIHLSYTAFQKLDRQQRHFLGENWRVHAYSGRSKAGGNNGGFLCDSQSYFPHSLQGGASAQRAFLSAGSSRSG